MPEKNGGREMLDQKDIDMIRQVVREEVDERASKTEDSLLDEIGRTQTYLEKQINEVKKNMDELSQYCVFLLIFIFHNLSRLTI